MLQSSQVIGGLTDRKFMKEDKVQRLIENTAQLVKDINRK